jgi:uncharacterized protein YqjF (DUF2071 family)
MRASCISIFVNAFTGRMSAFEANKKGFVYAIKGETNAIILLAYKIKRYNLLIIVTICIKSKNLEQPGIKQGYTSRHVTLS